MSLNTETRAALVFLVLYAILFALLLLGYATRRLKLRSRYTILILHVMVRLASQATGVAFGILGYSHVHLLVAYFILGAEGYFTLVVCTYRFLISWQYHNNADHDSWIEPKHPPGTPMLKRFLDSIAIFTKPPRPMAIMHHLLTGANAIIIAGGSLLAGSSTNVKQFNANLHTAKAMRIAGQSIFLAINAFLLYCIADAIRQCKREHSRVHPTLYLLLATWPFLFVRGLYGILASALTVFNYFAPSNYGPYGLTTSFVVSEYILSTTMEWSSCALIMLTYLTSRNDPKKGDC
jgi:hypothetical protein